LILLVAMKFSKNKLKETPNLRSFPKTNNF